MNDLIEMQEIWMPVAEGGEAYMSSGQNLKLVAVLVGGHPIILADGFALEKRQLTKAEADQILPNASASLGEHPSPPTEKE